VNDVSNSRVQGTVALFDEQSRQGSLLLDDGTPLEFSAAAFAASGLRLLRLGQRVRAERGPDGQVARIALITMP
jgi:2-phospho-L-lactate guanylyltransferase